MNKKISGMILATLSLTTALIAAPVAASSYTGTVQSLRISTGASPARVSIATTQATSCSQPWYAFENADASIGKIWVAALIAAKAQGKTVVITGSGTCDAWGIERVSYIDVQ